MKPRHLVCYVPSWGDDLDLLGRRHRHVELRARDALHKCMRGPCALLELQLPPLDLEVVALAVQPFQLNEQLACAVLAIDRARRRTERRQPQHRHGNSEDSVTHTTFSAARKSALRARGLRFTSASLGRHLRPMSFSRG